MGKLRCPICKSRQWRKEPSSGMLVCNEGHILQGYRNETIEQTEMSQHIMHKRTLKSVRKIAKEAKGNKAIYHNEDQARFLYLQSLQLLLRLQIAALSRLWKLPPEFEGICRDIWGIYMSSLPKRSIENIEDKRPTTLRDDAASESSLSDQEHSSESDSEESDESPDNGPGGDIAELLEGVSDSDSDTQEGESEASRRPQFTPINVKVKRSHTDHIGPSYTIAALVVACFVLRIPTVYMDFVELVKDYSLPYLDPIQRGLLPESMIRRMGRELQMSLTARRPPRTLQLHRIASRIAFTFHQKYHVSIPESNAPHIISKALLTLHAPAIFYKMTKALIKILQIPLTLHPSLSSSPIDYMGQTIAFQQSDNIPFELAVASVVSLLYKLIYGLDGTIRDGGNTTESILQLPIKGEILEAIQEDNQSWSHSSDRTVLDLSAVEVDEYLDFCTEALLGKKEGDSFIQNTFPLPLVKKDGINHWNRPGTHSGPIHEVETTPSDDPPQVLHRGQSYKIYCTEDRLGTLPSEYELVLSRAAHWCGVDVDDVALIVERYERRLVRGLQRKPKGAS
ncbi:hypothetical protein CPB86DRAFT_729351 [Serendipita vermifera]|nr:hypothetical protein CPB86DRAFT_729351 [Serendipita vermifera]